MVRKGFLVWITIVAILLAITFFVFIQLTQKEVSPEDSEAKRIVTICGGGLTESARSSLGINLSRQLRQIESATLINSSQMSGIIEKIKPDEIGRDIYESYVRCLNEQMKFSLSARGVKIASPQSINPKTAPLPPSATTNDNQEQAPASKADAKQLPTMLGSPPNEAKIPSLKTEGDCSSIIVGSSIGNITQQCTENSQ